MLVFFAEKLKIRWRLGQNVEKRSKCSNTCGRLCKCGQFILTCGAKTSQRGSQSGAERGRGLLAEAQRGRPGSRLAWALWEQRGALGGGAEGRGAVEGASSQRAARAALLLRLLGCHSTKRTVRSAAQTTVGTSGWSCCSCDWKRSDTG